MTQLNLDSTKKYLAGISGGPDSMALLDMCIKDNLDVVVCHINYKLRDHADIEEQLVNDYCKQHNLKMYVLYPKQQEKENFQKWARDVRYDFYKEIYDNEKCNALLLGHQKDDHIETYLMSKQRGSHGWNYGIAEKSVHHGMNIIRPLLNMRKAETRQYCLDNKVPFGDDESNFSNKYTRNKIRHSLIEPADDTQIDKWSEEISALNNDLAKQIEYIDTNYSCEEIVLDLYKKEAKKTRVLILRRLIQKYTTRILESEFINELDRQITNSNNNFQQEIDKDIFLCKEYGVVYCYKREVFSYQLNKDEQLITSYFKISNIGKTIESVTVNDDEYPLCIRSWKPEDAIVLRLGTKKVNRFFIDKKVKHKDRQLWPIITNNKGEVIFVSGIGCDINHFSTNASFFMIK